MKIGFDLDKVFINTPPFIPDFLIARLYLKRTNGNLQYRIPAKPEQIIRYISHYPFLRPPILKNMLFLKSIPKENNKLFLVSSRFGFLQKNTNRIINLYKLNKTFDEMHFNYHNIQPHIFKSEIINKLNLDKYIDDDLNLLKYIASRNNHISLFWLNKHLNKQISKSIRAITSISAALDK